ncbi:MAG: hypothetical protein LCH34_00345 [Firmicutes bacterium]|nr:hypothetical protein [Bacillota bacterium]
MKLKRIEHYQEIYETSAISDLMSQVIFNPTPGKIQNIAQSIYAKTQGRFYTVSVEERLIGLIGFSKVDNHKLILKHYFMQPAYDQANHKFEVMQEAMRLERASTLECECDDTELSFYKRHRFKIEKIGIDDIDGHRYRCTLTV